MSINEWKDGGPAFMLTTPQTYKLVYRYKQTVDIQLHYSHTKIILLDAQLQSVHIYAATVLSGLGQPGLLRLFQLHW